MVLVKRRDLFARAVKYGARETVRCFFRAFWYGGWLHIYAAFTLAERFLGKSVFLEPVFMEVACRFIISWKLTGTAQYAIVQMESLKRLHSAGRNKMALGAHL